MEDPEHEVHRGPARFLTLPPVAYRLDQVHQQPLDGVLPYRKLVAQDPRCQMGVAPQTLSAKLAPDAFQCVTLAEIGP
jgi:hypothetical protein